MAGDLRGGCGMRALRAVACASGAVLLGCAGPGVTECPMVRVGGVQVPLVDSTALELAALRRQASADLDCPRIDVEHTPAFGHDLLRVSGCGRRSIYVRVHERDEHGPPPTRNTVFPTTDVELLDVAHATPEAVAGWEAGGHHPAGELLELSVRASADLGCPRDQVAPYILSSRWRRVTEMGHVTDDGHRWRAEGCGRVAWYDMTDGGLVRAAVDATCEPYAAGCEGCACKESFLSWRLWEDGETSYGGPDAVELQLGVSYGPPYVDVLQQRGQSWRAVCEGRCRSGLDPKGTYRVELTVLPNRSSLPFSLPPGRRSVTARVTVSDVGSRLPKVSFSSAEEAPFRFIEPSATDGGAHDGAP